MDSVPSVFVFRQIPSSLADKAFAFHKSQANNEHIWPRTEDQIQSYAKDGELFAVLTSSGEFVAMCYSTLDEKENVWEIGGLTTLKEYRELHLGTLLVRFALAHTIAWYSPWESAQEIIAHVHDENPAPRNLLKRLAFVFAKKVEVPEGIAPASMKRNAEGKVTGDEFRFPPPATENLLKWFEEESKAKLADEKSSAAFEIDGGMDALIEALREAVAFTKSKATKPSASPSTSSSTTSPPAT
jgi:RimJ/RimL family protein N-acetyltransferase